MTSVHPQDAPQLWFGAAHWVPLPDGAWWPRRITPDLAATAYNPHFEHQARIPAGVHARFRTDATALHLGGRIPGAHDLTAAERARAAGTTAPQPAPATVSVIVDGVALDPLVTHPPEQPAHGEAAPREVAPGEISLGEWALGAGAKTVEVWLPHGQVWALSDARLAEASFVEAAPARPTWVAYGSSITQCAAAGEPWQTWPALVAREHQLELVSLGMGGQCHLDEAVEHTIAQAQPQYLSLCLGINIYGRGSYDERSLGSALFGFIRRVKAANPGAHIAVITPLFAGWREDQPNQVGLTVAQIRRTVAQVAGDLADSRLQVINGLDIVGFSDSELLAPDLLHPTHEGYAVIAQRISPYLARAWQLPGATPVAPLH